MAISHNYWSVKNTGGGMGYLTFRVIIGTADGSLNVAKLVAPFLPKLEITIFPKLGKSPAPQNGGVGSGYLLHKIVEQLPSVMSGQIGEGSIQTVNARELHAFLEVGKDFSTWMKDRIAQYDFVENMDYVKTEDLISPNSGSSKSRVRTVIEYHLSLDMAKEISMVERNEKGMQARPHPKPSANRLKLTRSGRSLQSLHLVPANHKAAEVLDVDDCPVQEGTLDIALHSGRGLSGLRDILPKLVSVKPAYPQQDRLLCHHIRGQDNTVSDPTERS